MKVKIKNKIYDSNIEPIMIILTEQDKDNISHMNNKHMQYCSFPDITEWTLNNYEKILQWMQIGSNNE